MTLRHFSIETDPLIEGLDPSFLERLDWARERAGFPFIITSGKRTIDENLGVGGVQDSSHVKGVGVDLACTNSVQRFAMVEALLYVGFKRIGIYDKHVHVDQDITLPQKVMWWGKSH
jgi:hypothetical protein